MKNDTAPVQAHILILDDDPDVLLALRLLLKTNGYAVTVDHSPRRLFALLEKGPYDAVFLDMNFSAAATDGREGFYWLKAIRKRDPDAVIIPLTAFGDVDLAVRAIKEGAADFILKPWNNEKLLGTLALALELGRSRREVRRLTSRQQRLDADLDLRFGEMIGRSGAVRRVLELVERVAATDASVLILGENGTGKELVARALHRRSARRSGAFVCVDLGAVAGSLFESELFGHVRGAFTDAAADRIGRFEHAAGGTLFLDEIGNLSPPLQAKLLRAVESREIVPVGSNRARPVDVRIVSATNQPVHELARRKEFRPDLLYRLNTIEITLPPLRERTEDIPLLAGHFASHYYRKYQKPEREIPRETLARLEAHDWPGNVRELKHALERAVLTSRSGLLLPEDFFFGRPEGPAEADGPGGLAGLERAAIEKSLRLHHGNVSRAAGELGLTRAALYRRMRKHGLHQKLQD